MASIWEPVATAGNWGSLPVQRANVLPTESSRMERPASKQSRFTYSRARRSSSENTTRVTAGAGTEEKVAKLSSSAERRAELMFTSIERGCENNHQITASGWRFQSL